jgi:cytochrome c oxidase cbb3-type subunit I/II
MIRPLRHETERFGEYSKPGESVYEHPFLWGSRRIGPDLARRAASTPTSGTCATSRNPRSINVQARSCRRTRTS